MLQLSPAVSFIGATFRVFVFFKSSNSTLDFHLRYWYTAVAMCVLCCTFLDFSNYFSIKSSRSYTVFFRNRRRSLSKKIADSLKDSRFSSSETVGKLALESLERRDLLSAEAVFDTGV